MEDTTKTAAGVAPKKKPKSIFDLEGEWLRLLEMAHQGYDPETGEYLEPEDLDKAFAELTGDVEDKVAGCGFVLMRLKKDAAMVDEEAKRLKKKKDQILAGRERLEERLRELMVVTNTAKVKKPFVSVSLAKEQLGKVEVLDEGKVPGEFMTVPVAPDPKPMLTEIKTFLKSALDSGKEISWAKLVPSKRTLTVR